MRAVLLGLVAVATAAIAEPQRERADQIIAEARASMLVDPAVARAKAQAAERVGAAIPDEAARSTIRATALWLEGEAAARLKDFAGAMPKLAEALQIVRRHAPGSQLEGDLLISAGSVHSDTGKVVEALREFQRAHAIFTRLKNARNQVMALVCIASLYSDAKDYPTALRYYDEALSTGDIDPQMSLSIQNNRASTLRNSGRYAEAERGFRTALAIAEAMHSKVLSSQIMRNIARLQLKQGNLSGADRTVARGMALVENADPFSRKAMLSVAAQVAFDRGDRQRAQALIGESMEGLDPTDTPLSFREAHETAYEIFHAAGEDAQALVHLLAVKRLDDQVTTVATSNGAALMAARFDYANQELRIARLKAEDLQHRVTTAREQARTQRLLFFGGMGATAIVIMALLWGLVVARRSRDQVRAANGDLALVNTELGKALAAKTEFLATTSHEIRTPLNGILGMTQVMLADDALPAATRERLSVVQAAGTTMRTLVDDILDVAKMENGKLVLEQAPFDLQATILDATRLWETQASAKNIAFVRSLQACPRLVTGDAARVRQVVFNLLSNALKFTEAGEIAISADERAGDEVAIVVRDSGIGIPADKLEAIFESFRQADAGTTRQFGGTGLGLSICRQLARAMGGDVRVESRVGEGSTFTVMLPLLRAEVQGAAGLPDAGDPGLLIVERNPIARSLLKTLLEPHAARLLFANDAEGALAVLGRERVSCVLLDEASVSTDEAGGAALTRIVAAANDAAARIVVLRGRAGSAEPDAAALPQDVCVLQKPVSGPALVATLFRPGNDPLVSRAA